MNPSSLQNVCLAFLFLLNAFTAQAQQVPVGQWQTHFSYNSAISVEKVRDKIFAGRSNLYSYSLTNHDYAIYSKVNGLSDVNIQFIRYDASSDNLLIVYDNGNIDLVAKKAINGCQGGNLGEEITIDYRQALSLATRRD